MTEVTREDRAAERRQRRIDRRRTEILEAAARVFAAKGYANTTTREIAEAADVAEGTLYNYFPGKRDILLAIANETEPPMEAALLEAGPLATRDDLLNLMTRALDISASQVNFLKSIMAEVWVSDDLMFAYAGRSLSRVHRRLAELVAAKIEDGLFRQVDPALTAQLMIGLTASIMVPTLFGAQAPRGPEERRQTADAIVSLLLDGLVAR